jgi:pre-rRNA-processing protein TSR3
MLLHLIYKKVQKMLHFLLTPLKLLEMNYQKTIIIRHKKENLKKCSLTGLQRREDLLILTYPDCSLVTPPWDFSGYLLLTMEPEAPLLTKEDNEKGILLLDGTWRLAAKMESNIPGLNKLEKRALPSRYVTAYPRRQEACPDPRRGLASIEALAAAYFEMGRSIVGLLDHYYWKNRFLPLFSPPCS